MVANVGAGLLLRWAPAWSLLVWITVCAMVATLAARWVLPPDPVHEAGHTLPGRERWRGVGALLRDPMFMLAVVSVGLIQASHGFYYGFSVLAWKAQGLGADVGGLLWGVGVAAEVAFLWLLEPWRRRVGPERLVLLGGLGAVVRWTCLALSPPFWLLVPIQTLHALSYAATFVGSLQLVERARAPVQRLRRPDAELGAVRRVPHRLFDHGLRQTVRRRRRPRLSGDDRHRPCRAGRRGLPEPPAGAKRRGAG